MKYLLARAGQALLTLWVVLSFAFVGLQLAGDPVALLSSEAATPAERTALRESLGLNAPIFERYLRFTLGAVQGKLGESFVFHRPALPLLLERAPVTLLLVGLTVGFAALVGVPLGVLAASKRGSALDRGVLGFSAVAVSAPSFFVGIALIFVFSVQLRLLPSQGANSVAQLVLPVLSLSLGRIAVFARFVRNGLLEELPQGYIRTARAKGVQPWRVLIVHALKNALLPLLTILGLQLGGLFSGTVVTETIFALPGMNRVALEGLTHLDYPLVLAFTLLSSAVITALNWVVDALYAVVDPRVRYA